MKCKSSSDSVVDDLLDFCGKKAGSMPGVQEQPEEQSYDSPPTSQTVEGVGFKRSPEGNRPKLSFSGSPFETLSPTKLVEELKLNFKDNPEAAI